jgi:hypothetical protein
LGSCIALLALALQLVLAFGHVHVAAGLPASERAQPTTLAHSADDPADHEAPAGTQHYCPVCALLHLAGSLIHAQTPALGLPDLTGGVPHFLPVALASSALKLAQFHARAPPIP